ncbi:tyrosine-type recombinase/integrase [Aquibium oceanicum]|uniref:Integrase n=1 Tax=Aquibium oceanicum TaxID=1670800 RepID=A0A1L3SVL8_9HYPH|nr:site-specific integrase [Aquibium oceanicum]APH73428.1 integrase [Aquibium oceanicum]
MVTLELKGVHRVRVKGRTYWYAWRGGPRLKGEPGTPEFVASYNEAVADHRAPDATRFRSVILAYRASADFQKLAESTRRQWSRWLDRIDEHFGELRTAQFDRAEKIRPIIRKWRSTYADRPRTADYAMQVLSRVLSYAVDPMGKIAANPAEGIKQLYTSSRAEIIWTDEEITALKASNSEEIGHAVDLAAHTGLRLGDLLRVSWSHIGEHEITLPTGKSSGKRHAVIPLYDDLREILSRIPRRATTVLTSSKNRPWTTDGFGSSFNKAKARAGLADRDLHFHDLRGTAATKFYKAGLSERVIAEIMGWEEQSVSRIIRRYVGRAAATRAAIEQLAKGK